jgi:SH3 and multiple ankyrin repeat domains protein
VCSANGETTRDDTIVISRDALSALMINNDRHAPRTIVLQRGKKGFGFVLRGSRGESLVHRQTAGNCRLCSSVAGKLFQPTPSFPALQFLDSIEKGSNADKAGLKQNDYVLEVSGHAS